MTDRVPWLGRAIKLRAKTMVTALSVAQALLTCIAGLCSFPDRQHQQESFLSR